MYTSYVYQRWTSNWHSSLFVLETLLVQEEEAAIITMHVHILYRKHRYVWAQLCWHPARPYRLTVWAIIKLYIGSHMVMASFAKLEFSSNESMVQDAYNILFCFMQVWNVAAEKSWRIPSKSRKMDMLKGTSYRTEVSQVQAYFLNLNNEHYKAERIYGNMQELCETYIAPGSHVFFIMMSKVSTIHTSPIHHNDVVTIPFHILAFVMSSCLPILSIPFLCHDPCHACWGWLAPATIDHVCCIGIFSIRGMTSFLHFWWRRWVRWLPLRFGHSLSFWWRRSRFCCMRLRTCPNIAATWFWISFRLLRAVTFGGIVWYPTRCEDSWLTWWSCILELPLGLVSEPRLSCSGGCIGAGFSYWSCGIFRE